MCARDTSVWQTDELRHHKPTPGDEARAGLNIVEQSLWKAVPHYLRRVSDALKKGGGCIWFDRDGNSNVTAKVLVGLIDILFVNLLLMVLFTQILERPFLSTEDLKHELIITLVYIRSLLYILSCVKWMTIDLYIREVDSLKFELSLNRCSDILSKLAQEILEPESASDDHQSWDHQCYNRNQVKQQAVALPTQLPARADQPCCTGEHPIILLKLGTHSEWDEEKKLEFLTRELKGKRPLVPLSMEASDILAVELLQKDARLAVSGEIGKPCPGGTEAACGSFV
ncbi:putative phosphoenolpyruvate carboxylase [Rosa chinensis]|uniref:Putative phosphoenolpyruvate carboxylase n=1 Tax=Rosa chinensis TaxID=74649 RepID=A0A2P6QB98_ROSCH|nr:putative phosphoenolpyruvate carboxylase [Rosa chinensis]